MAITVCFKVENLSKDKGIIMSLLENAYENFTIVNKSIVDDGYGGTTTVWKDGATIKGAVYFDNSSQMKIARVMGVTSTYTLTVKKNIELDYHTVLRRESDGKIFRTTSNSDDKKTPPTAGLDMRQYDVEEWKLT